MSKSKPTPKGPVKGTKSTPKSNVKALNKSLKPSVQVDGKDLVALSAAEQRQIYYDRRFQMKISRLDNDRRSAYNTNWGKAVVNQSLADDPGPINALEFAPVKRWISVYRSPEAGEDGTKIIMKSAIDTALGLTVAQNNNRWVLRTLHIWIAPNSVSTHFSGLLILGVDATNGVVGGTYTDIAPYGEFVKFQVKYNGEGFISTNTDSLGQVIFSIGGSAKWNAQVYGHFETYD